MKRSGPEPLLSKGTAIGTARCALLAWAAWCAIAGNARAAEDMAWPHQGRQGSVTLGVGTLAQKWRSAFYVNRGFSAAVIQPYASACGFSFAMRNEGHGAITTRLGDWRAVDAQGKSIPFRLPESWEREWEQAGVVQAARIAFHWAQFQSENTFEPGDWIMGMATLAAVPTSPFQLIARYRDAEGAHEIVLEQLQCAHD